MICYVAQCDNRRPSSLVDQAQQHTTILNDRRDIRLVYRPSAQLHRLRFASKDLLYLAWMVLGPLLVLLLPSSGYAGVARMFARLNCRGRAKAATAAAAIAGIPAERAAAAMLDLFAGRYVTYLRLFRALIFNRHIDVTLSGLEHLEAALAPGRGAVLWIADFIEAPTASKIGFARAGHPLSHLSRPEHGFSKSRFGIAVLNPVRTRYEDRFLHERIMYDRRAPGSAHRAILRRLKDNGVVSVMASAHEGRALADVRFLAGHLRLATGPLRLARAAGCAVLPVFTLPGPRAGDFELIVEAPLQFPQDGGRDDAIAAAVIDFTSRLERYVAQWPMAWVGWRRSNLRVTD